MIEFKIKELYMSIRTRVCRKQEQKRPRARWVVGWSPGYQPRRFTYCKRFFWLSLIEGYKSKSLDFSHEILDYNSWHLFYLYVWWLISARRWVSVRSSSRPPKWATSSQFADCSTRSTCAPHISRATRPLFARSSSPSSKPSAHTYLLYFNDYVPASASPLPRPARSSLFFCLFLYTFQYSILHWIKSQFSIQACAC